MLPRRRSCQWPGRVADRVRRARVGPVLVGEGLRVHDAAADRGESVLVPARHGEEADLVEQLDAAGLVLEVADLVGRVHHARLECSVYSRDDHAEPASPVDEPARLHQQHPRGPCDDHQLPCRGGVRSHAQHSPQASLGDDDHVLVKQRVAELRARGFCGQGS